jgi:basic membrane lipoprotein Med (substrate-binding protein (PBP1-ABC) superfamily)
MASRTRSSKRSQQLLLAAIVVVAGCGGHSTARTTTPASTTRAATPTRLLVGVVGPVRIAAPGVAVTHGSLAAVSGLPLVVVSASAEPPDAVAAAAAANPNGHFVYVGASVKPVKRRNLVGVVLRDDQAALLAGILAGLVAADQGGTSPRVAWVGPLEEKLVRSFAAGTHHIDPRVVVLRNPSTASPADCKEASLAAIMRGAVALVAQGGLCARAASDAAAAQNRVVATLRQFEVPDVAVAAVVRSALAGTYSGNEDLVFGAASGAIAVRSLDPRLPPEIAVRVRRAAQQLQAGRRITG